MQWFLLSIVAHALRGMNPIVSFIVVIIIAYYWRGQFHVVDRLLQVCFSSAASSPRSRL